MPVSSSRGLPLLVGLACASTLAHGAEPCAPPSSSASIHGAATTPAEVTVDVRDFGAIGDGRVHFVREWLGQGRFATLVGLQRKYPFVDRLDWSIDEVAFAAAKRALPRAGGTIHFPVGHYVAARYPWRIWQDNVRLTGDGADRTILSTAPGVCDGLSVAPYRHSGWLEGAAREFPYGAGSGGRGEDELQLPVAAWADDFDRGEIVFIRNGANRFDQDYGEFNEIASADDDGRLRFKYPFSRDYTLASFNWAGEVAADFTMPAPGAAVRVALRSDKGYFIPGERATVSVGENVFTVEKVYPARAGVQTVRLGNFGRANAARGTVVRAGARIGKARTIVKLTETVRNFRCENLQVVGRRKALTISNSYRTSFSDCIFVRDLREGGFAGGLTIDGDGGRFARFDRCTINSLPAVGMQFARSFGGVTFCGCTFSDTNVAFTEFAFDCEVARCTFNVKGSPALTNVVVAGKSCGGLRFIDNEMRASGVKAIFDTQMDIHSQKHGSDGEIVVRGNTVETDNAAPLVARPASERLAVSDNSVTTR